MRNDGPCIQRRARRKTGAFSLIELLVIIAIIAILIGITVVGAARLRESARESHARSTLAALNGIASAYEARSRRAIDHLDRDGTYEFSNGSKRWPGVEGQPAPTGPINGDLTDEEQTLPVAERNRVQAANAFIARFVAVVRQVPELETRLYGLGDDVLTDLDGDGFLELRDPWGGNYAYAFNVQRQTGSPTEDDFLPDHDRPFFASAGADQRWGVARQAASYDSGDAEHVAARDNLYSFDLDRTSDWVGQ